MHGSYRSRTKIASMFDGWMSSYLYTPQWLAWYQQVAKLILIFWVRLGNEEWLAPVRFFFLFRSCWRQFLLTADRCYDAWERLFILRWILCCFGTDCIRYLVVKWAPYFMFFKTSLFCSSASIRKKEQATRWSLNNSFCRQAPFDKMLKSGSNWKRPVHLVVTMIFT